jgi:hypothetical protein
MKERIYIFTSHYSPFPLGVFYDMENATEWIKKNSLTGILGEYPINIGLYDWAIENQYFIPKNDAEKQAKFIEKFTCASMNHFHFENGDLE